MNCLEFEDLNGAVKYFAVELNNQQSVVSSNKANEASYKKQIGGELIQQFFKIKNPKKVLCTWNSYKWHEWWMYGEILSELLQYDPPIMYKYRNDLYPQHYELLEDGRMQYTYANRFFEYNQFVNIYRKLKDNPTSKRCVVDIFTPYDTAPDRADAPCTTMYHFICRDNKLNMTVFYRSHDFFGGFKVYDFALSSFILQMMASWLNMEVGELAVYCNSLHFYERDRGVLDELVKEVRVCPDKSSRELFLDYGYSIEGFWKDLRLVKQIEEYSYAFNFKEAVKQSNLLSSDLFKDIALVYIKKNKKRESDLNGL